MSAETKLAKIEAYDCTIVNHLLVAPHRPTAFWMTVSLYFFSETIDTRMVSKLYDPGHKAGPTLLYRILPYQFSCNDPSHVRSWTWEAVCSSRVVSNGDHQPP